MKAHDVTAGLILLLLAGCRGEPSPQANLTPIPTRSTPSAVSSPRAVPTPSRAAQSAPAPENVPHLLEEKEIRAKLAEQSDRSLPKAEDLQVGSRPFESSKPVRQRLSRHLASTTDSHTALLVEQALTFDPNEPEPVTRLRLYRTCRQLLDKEAFGALDAIADNLRAKRLLQQDGTWLLGYVYECLTSGDGPLGTHPDLAQSKVRFERWLEQNPRSLAARYCLADILVAWAWEARGGGYASQVTDEGWRLLKERLQKAREVLGKAETQKEDPYLHAELITIGMGQGRPASEVRKSFDRAVAIEPYHVNVAYRAYGLYLQPKWHGSVAEHQSFVNEVVIKTKSRLGEGLYLVLTENAGKLEVDKARQLRAARDLTSRNPASFVYFTMNGQQTLKLEGPQAARALYEEAVAGKTKLPLSEGDRLRLRNRVDQEFGASGTPSPSEKSATVLGVSLGMSQEDVQKLLGPPDNIEPQGRSHKDMRYARREGLYLVRVSNDTGRVVGLTGAGAEARGKTVRRGMTYPELEKALGKPTEIREGHYQDGRIFLLIYEPLGLVIGWRATDGKLSIFRVPEDLRAWAGDSPPLTMEEWKKFWKQ